MSMVVTGLEGFHYSKKIEVGDGSWRRQAECQKVDPDLFFIERGESSSPAKAVCRSCPVREECLEYALTNDEKFGVWGGLSERERRRMRQQRNQARSTLPHGLSRYKNGCRCQECRDCNTEYQRHYQARRGATA